MFRIQLRTYLIVCTVVGAVAGLYLRDRWDSRIHWQHETMGTLLSPTNYHVTWFTERHAFDRDRLLCIRVGSRFSKDRADDWKVGPKGVFFRGQRPAMGNVYFMLDGDVQIIPLAPQDFDELEQITSDWLEIQTPRDMTSAERDQWQKDKAARSPMNSQVWKTKVEPIILPLIAERHRQLERARREKESHPWPLDYDSTEAIPTKTAAP